MTKQTRLEGDKKSQDAGGRGTAILSPLGGEKGRVLAFFRDSPGDQFSPKIVAKYLRAKHSSVKRICLRLHRRGFLKRDLRGWYQFRADLDRLRETEEPPAGVHGIKIEVRIPDCPFVPGGWISGTTCKSSNHKPPRLVYGLTFGKAWVTVTQHESGLFEIWTKASFSLDEFLMYLTWLEGVFLGAGYPFWQYVPLLKQIGLQRDYGQVQLKGIQNVQVQYARDLFIGTYKKKAHQTRIEAHCWEEMGLLEAVRVLDQLRDRPAPKVKEFDGVGYR